MIFPAEARAAAPWLVRQTTNKSERSYFVVWFLTFLIETHVVTLSEMFSYACKCEQFTRVYIARSLGSTVQSALDFLRQSLARQAFLT